MQIKDVSILFSFLWYKTQDSWHFLNSVYDSRQAEWVIIFFKVVSCFTIASAQRRNATTVDACRRDTLKDNRRTRGMCREREHACSVRETDGEHGTSSQIAEFHQRFTGRSCFYDQRGLWVRRSGACEEECKRRRRSEYKLHARMCT